MLLLALALMDCRCSLTAKALKPLFKTFQAPKCFPTQFTTTMSPPRLRSALRVLLSINTSPHITRPSIDTFYYLRALNASLPATTLTFIRHATHQAQGRANGPKNSPGKRLGAKKTGGMFPKFYLPSVPSTRQSTLENQAQNWYDYSTKG